jgi:biopolymer transport protein ExbB/TolQ
MSNVTEAWGAMGLAARVILILLAAFAATLVYVVVDRVLTFRRALRAAGTGATPDPRQLLRHLRLLAAIKVTAPMLGLLATCLGLINASVGLAGGGVPDLRCFAAGLAEALSMTVLGLLVGLPAWWSHSWLRRWAERIAAQGAVVLAA